MLKKILFTILSILPISVAAQTDKQCIASAIYYEANTESAVGQRAVMDVILNRAKLYKKSVCAIIKQPRQFSWYGKKPILPLNRKMKELLAKMDEVGRVLISEKYLYFFRKDLRPKWARKMDCVRLESHLFCRHKEIYD